MDPGAFTFHHLGVAVKSIAKAIPVYQELFGYELLSGPFDDPIQRVSVCFLGRRTAGEIVIELVAPLGTDTPIDRVLAKGVGAYHTCYEVEDLDRSIETLRSKKCLIVSEPVPAVAFANRRIAWLFTPTNQLVELVEK
jgi:methylmalonyl-CoA/ethylmalonyl-CoA epimerase